MITCADLQKITHARLKDANVLLTNRRYDGAMYLVGYAVEIALKRRFCQDNGEVSFPSTQTEFETWRNKYGVRLNTHALQNLADATTWDCTSYWAEWSSFTTWAETLRYSPIGYAAPKGTQRMIAAANVIVGVL